MFKKKKISELEFGCRTDTGSIRDHNEDSLFAQNPLFIVADGMGGHAAGEVASEIAVNVVEQNAPKTADVDKLAEAVEMANTEVIKASIDGRGRSGMGTTLTCAIIENNKISIAHVGDSRAYLMSSGNLNQITHDHSFVADLISSGQITEAEARYHPKRSLITRALGSDPEMFADKYNIEATDGDRLLLCSDGLYSMIEDSQISDIMLKNPDPQKCADKLIDYAIAAGGSDNITVIVVDIIGSTNKNIKKAKNKIRRSFILIIFLTFLILFGAVFCVVSLVQNSAYLKNEDGKIVVYKGVEGNILGFELSSVYERTDISVSDLRQSTQEHFNDGVIRVDGIDGANRAIDTYNQEVQELKYSRIENKQQDSTTSQDSSNTSSTNSQNSQSRR